MATIIKANGEKVSLIGEKKDSSLTLDQMRNGIGGGYVETLPLGNNRMLLFDEEGNMKQLPMNIEATLMLKNSIHKGNHVNILGDVILCKQRGGELY